MPTLIENFSATKLVLKSVTYPLLSVQFLLTVVCASLGNEASAHPFPPPGGWHGPGDHCDHHDHGQPSTNWCDAQATEIYPCGGGWYCGYPQGDRNRGCVWPKGHGDHWDHGDRGSNWCHAAVDSGYYDCGSGWYCGFISGDQNRGCVWQTGSGPLLPASAPQAPSSPDGNSGNIGDSGNSGDSGNTGTGGDKKAASNPSSDPANDPNAPVVVPLPPSSGDPSGGSVPSTSAPDTPTPPGVGGVMLPNVPFCDNTATGRFDCGNGAVCGYPAGNTATECQYPQ